MTYLCNRCGAIIYEPRTVTSRENLDGASQTLEGAAQGQRVDDGGQHTHLVAGDTVKAAPRTAEAAENVAAADNNSHLHAAVGHFLDLSGVTHQPFGVDAVA